jgi:uncharacterized protein YidB (DUF937 family)
MGLLDILNGMQNGSRGQVQPGSSGSGGMSPWMIALLGLLAHKAIKNGGFGNVLGSAPGGGASGGGLGDILGGVLGGGARAGGMPGGGILGGLLGGAATGGLLNGGLRNVIGDLERNGHGDAVRSWVGPGANQSIPESDLASAVGIDDIDAVAQQTGMPREQVLSSLSEHLPEFVNQLTPDGRLPDDQEASTWV